MKIAHTIAETREFLRPARSAGKSIGFVPTMGYFHAGHLALMERARAENDVAAVSLFVNPTQFGPKEDFGQYPRDFDRDACMASDAGVDLLFAPPVEVMYPETSLTWVVVEGLTERLEGASRPGHFRGVATVVAKLFNIVQPDRAYFGEKDFQQLQVIRRMVRDLNFPVEIVAVPTVREEDGLAMSSRNTYLDPEERRAALVLQRALARAQELAAEGERDAAHLRTAMQEVLAREPRARVDYVSIADPETLRERERLDGPSVVSIAVYIGKTRLIDNARIGPVA